MLQVTRTTHGLGGGNFSLFLGPKRVKFIFKFLYFFFFLPWVFGFLLLPFLFILLPFRFLLLPSLYSYLLLPSLYLLLPSLYLILPSLYLILPSLFLILPSLYLLLSSLYLLLPSLSVTPDYKYPFICAGAQGTRVAVPLPVPPARGRHVQSLPREGGHTHVTHHWFVRNN